MKKGIYWFIVFESPLSEEQNRLVRAISLGLQDPRETFLFSYDFLPNIPQKGLPAPLRQGNSGSAVLRITRARVDGHKPSLESIAKRIVPLLEKHNPSA